MSHKILKQRLQNHQKTGLDYLEEYGIVSLRVSEMVKPILENRNTGLLKALSNC